MKKILVFATLLLTLALAATAAGAETFALSENYYTMHPQTRFKLSAPEGVTVASWISSNEAVATVSDGLVSSKANGIAVITATSTAGDTGKCTILVRTTQAAGITLPVKTLLISPGRTARLTPEITPFDSSYKTVLWESSKPSAVTVTSDGVVKPLATGNAVITALLEGTKYKATCKVTVKDLTVRSVAVTPAKVTAYVGEEIALTAKLNPLYSGEVDQPFEWSSLDESIATVDANGLVKALSPGLVKIKAFNPGSGKFKYASITVKSGVSSVSFINGDARTYINAGETVDLSERILILPQSASGAPVTWSSGNKDVATVDSEGVVTGVKTGTANIKATADGKSASLEVRVRGGNVCEVTLSAGGDVILGGDYRQIDMQPYAPLSGEQKFDQLIAENGYDYVFKNLSKIFNSDDITVINLEGVLTSGNTQKSGRPHYLRSRPEYANSILKSAGIDVCCLANNHTLDYNWAGYKATKRALDSAGIKYMGHLEGEDCVIKVEKNGVAVKIGFCAWQMPKSREAMQKEIVSLRKRCDIVVASFHWANSRQWYANVDSYMRANARAALKFGADLVLGHHRHVPSGIERYGDKLIVYDLANLVTGLKHLGYDDSMIFQITWRVDETGYVEEAGFKVIPVKTTVTSETYPFADNGFGKLGMPVNDWQPDIVTGSEGRRIIDFINGNSYKVKVPYYYG